VHKRLIDVGVMSNLDMENPRRVPTAFRKDLRVIGETPSVPRALELVRNDLDPKVQARLHQVLCDAAKDPEARDAMQGFFQTTRFLPMDAASQRALDNFAAGVARVRGQVE
jgi:phosphonate transport system substrate-binding protein